MGSPQILPGAEASRSILTVRKLIPKLQEHSLHTAVPPSMVGLLLGTAMTPASMRLGVLAWVITLMICTTVSEAISLDLLTDPASKPDRSLDGGIAAALVFLQRHHDAAGGWRVGTAAQTCVIDGPKIPPPTEYADHRSDIVVSAIALRCFLRAQAASPSPLYDRIIAQTSEWLYHEAASYMEEETNLFVISAWLETLSMIDSPPQSTLVEKLLQGLEDSLLRDPASHLLSMPSWISALPGAIL